MFLRSHDNTDELTVFITERFSVDGIRPVVVLDQRPGRPPSVTVDFPLPLEPKGQTSFQMTLSDALRECLAARPGDSRN
jgi:hypothetical protein